MTIIYEIKNYAIHSVNYVCDSQETMDAAIEKKININGIFIIGTIDDANKILETNQKNYLDQKSEMFTALKGEVLNNGDILWSSADLSLEQQNTDIPYSIFDPNKGTHTNVVGLQNALDTQNNIKNDFLIFSGLNSYITHTSIPEPLTIKAQ